MKTQIRSLLTLVCAASASLLIMGSPAYAGYTVTLQQVGPDVVATGSGPIDLTGLSFANPGSSFAEMAPNSPDIITGATVNSVDLYGGVSGPTSFGSGGFIAANSGSGDNVGITSGNSGHFLTVPGGYVSGSALSDTATWNSATFSSLGVTPGTYEWTWGNGANQNFTLQAVPEAPVGFLLMLGALSLFGASRFRSFQAA